MRDRYRIAVLMCLAVPLCVSSCEQASNRGLQELTREVSPDGHWEAVLARDLIGGATVGSMYYVYVTLAGSSLDDAGREILRATRLNTADFRFVWEANDFLTIVHGTAQIWHFRNFRSRSSEDHYIEVRLSPQTARSL